VPDDAIAYHPLDAGLVGNRNITRGLATKAANFLY
jgi:hypothetical protein